MAIKRYTADQDNTITNAYKANLTTRGVSGNMGQSDILEVFHIYGQAASSSSENARILIQFPITDIATDRTAGDVPASGSVSFYLRMFNAEHSQPTPKDFTLTASAVSTAWQEGLGLDMENYSDIDASNWITASDGPTVKWSAQGGDYYTDNSSSFQQTFDTGFEDMEIDITPLVEQWLDSAGNVLGSKTNNGLGIFLTASQEDAEVSYYTKMFFARESQYFFKRPVVEARWNSATADNRGNFYLSSSLLPAADNLMTLYLYNIVKGQLTDIPDVGTGTINVSVYSGSATNTTPSGSQLFLPVGGGIATTGDVNVTGGWSETGIYTASFAYASSSVTTLFDLWHSASVEYHTGSAITLKTFDSEDYNANPTFVSNIIDMKSSYTQQERNAFFRIYTRKKNWSPNIYVKASEAIPNYLIENAYYQIERVSDGFKVAPFGTGSLNQTKMSYDASGSYFTFDMGMLEADTVYSIGLAYKINGKYSEQPETFRFRVEE
tara:strand:- start:4401 stop:5882 length:1482 start_codon:yes stop_codon:yes gene_type:complete